MTLSPRRVLSLTYLPRFSLVFLARTQEGCKTKQQKRKQTKGNVEVDEGLLLTAKFWGNGFSYRMLFFATRCAWAQKNKKLGCSFWIRAPNLPSSFINGDIDFSTVLVTSAFLEQKASLCARQITPSTDTSNLVPITYDHCFLPILHLEPRNFRETWRRISTNFRKLWQSKK